MFAASLVALAALSAAPAAETAASVEESATARPPVSPPSEWTHMFRAGFTAFDAVGAAGTCEECWFPTGSINPAAGVRLDYGVQRGTGYLRWHNILALELGWGMHYLSDASACNTDPTGRCDGVDRSVGFAAAFFAGTGIRLDGNPRGESASIMELDGTIGASTAPSVGLVGVHWGLGARFDTSWELLLSVEVDVLDYAHGSVGLVFGRSL